MEMKSYFSTVPNKLMQISYLSSKKHYKNRPLIWFLYGSKNCISMHTGIWQNSPDTVRTPILQIEDTRS